MRYLLAIFLAVVVSVAYSQTEPKAKSKIGGNKTEQDKRDAQSQPLVKEGIPSIPTKAEAEEKQKHHSDNLQVASRISADIKGLHKEAKTGMFAPAGTPKEIIDKISNEMGRILATPEIVERLVSQGLEPLISNPEQFAALLKSDMAKFVKLIKDANIKVD